MESERVCAYCQETRGDADDKLVKVCRMVHDGINRIYVLEFDRSHDQFNPHPCLGINFAIISTIIDRHYRSLHLSYLLIASIVQSKVTLLKTFKTFLLDHFITLRKFFVLFGGKICGLQGG